MSNNSYRYPGVRPFTPEDAHLFFGRKTDIDKLVRYLRTEDLVVLHGKSGLGKSSLINAGILPLIGERKGRRKTYTPIQMRFNSYNPRAPRDLFGIFNQNLVRETNILDEIPAKFITPLHAFKSLELSQRESAPNRYLLILDQFEELFTYPQKEVEAFGHELADLYNRRVPSEFRKLIRRERLVNEPLEKLLSEPGMSEWIESPVEVKILIAIRSDKFNLLDHLSDYLPEILLNSRILEPLTRKQAKEAIEKPARMDGEFESPTFGFSASSLEKILDFLASENHNEVEGFQLQIICRNIEEQVVDFASNGNTDKRIEVVKASKGSDYSYEIKDVDSDFGDILRRYYDNQIEKLGSEEVQMQARLLIEEQLIAEDRRVSVDQAVIKDFASDELLNKLVDSRIIRREPNNLGGFSYEISHDTLLAPIMEARGERRIVEEQEQKRLDALEAEKKRQEELQREKEAQEKELAQARAEKAELEKERALQAQQAERRNKYNLLGLLIAVLIITGLSLSWWWTARDNNKILSMRADSLSSAFNQLDSISSNVNKFLQDSLNLSIDRLDALQSELGLSEKGFAEAVSRQGDYREIMSKISDTLDVYGAAPNEIPSGMIEDKGGKLFIHLYLYGSGDGLALFDLLAGEKPLELVRKVANVLINYPQYRINIEGHTDDGGTYAQNVNNSLARASKVKNVFLDVFEDDKAEPIWLIAKGETSPLKPGRENRALNRRVDIVLSPK